MNTALTWVIGRPRDGELLRDYARHDATAQLRAYGPAHHAELQAFYNMGKLQRFYALLDDRFAPGGQDRFRTEVTVHWLPQLELGTGTIELNNARAGRFILKMADAGLSIWPEVIDGPGEFSIFAHEYHHHIQESLAKDGKWTLFPGFTLPPNDLLFPHADVNCTPKPACLRRVSILEGTADAFGELAVGRGVLGTSAVPNLPLTELLSRCDDREGFETSATIGPGLIIGNAPVLPARLTCTSIVFGSWALNSNNDTCYIDAQDNQSLRRAVIGGALHLYQRRFREAGIGPVFPGQHMLEAQRKLLKLTDTERPYHEALIAYLRSQPSPLTRRYEHTARAAFAEKGVFSVGAEVFAAGTFELDLDQPHLYQHRCDPTGSVPCSTSRARAISLTTLVASGPLRWNDDPDDASAPIPTFDVYAPVGLSYEQAGGPGQSLLRVHLEFSDQADFSTGAFFERVPITIGYSLAPAGGVPLGRVNCAPPGFARVTPPGAVWRDAVRAADASGGRLYYRLRQCLAGADVDDPDNCVVSTTPTSPAFTTVSPPSPTGCNCQLPGLRGRPEPWAAWALALAAASLRLRRRGPLR